MSLLFESDSSTARFKVNTTGVELATSAAGACCAHACCGAIAIAKIPRAMTCFEAIPLPPIHLLIAQRFNRLERSRLFGRQPAEKESRRTRHQKRQHHALPRNRHPQVSRQKLLH